MICTRRQRPPTAPLHPRIDPVTYPRNRCPLKTRTRLNPHKPRVGPWGLMLIRPMLPLLSVVVLRFYVAEPAAVSRRTLNYPALCSLRGPSFSLLPRDPLTFSLLLSASSCASPNHFTRKPHSQPRQLHPSVLIKMDSR